MSPHFDPDLLAAYLVNGLDTHRRQIVDQHLAACVDCRNRLESLNAVDNHLREALPLQVRRLRPPLSAWQHLQSGLTAPRRYGLRLALAAAVVLSVALLFVPPVNAALRRLATGWLGITVPGSGTMLSIDSFTAFTPLVPSNLPAGFDLTVTGVHNLPQGDVLQLTYSRGEEVFMLVQENAGMASPPPAGRPVDLDGAQGWLQDPAETMEESDRLAFKQGTIRLLSWTRGEVALRLYSNMPAEDMLALARSIRPARR